jgi:hypothetical protein
MRILITGRGTSGSWQIRGAQLGAAIGATVKQGVTVADCRSADVVVVVKRATPETLAALRTAGTPWAFDALDFYPQPQCGTWSRATSIAWVRDKLEHYRPTAVVWPNQKMREDCDTGLPGIVLRHHHRPGIRVNPIRDRVQAIGYEGAPAYVEAWRSAIERECARRGWRFVANPQHLADLDIVLALRGGQWAGYVSRHWKSAVKLANAHASGTPFVGQQECGYMETATGCEYWAEDAASLRTSLDWLTPHDNREMISQRFLQQAYPVAQAAKDLAEFLCCVVR